MEKESEFTQFESERFGKNVEMHVIFVRHGEKNEDGKLSEEGKIQASNFGKELERKDAIKGYSSPMPRALETVEKIIENSPHDKKLVTRLRTEIGFPKISQNIVKKWKELEKQGPNALINWFLEFGTKKPDAETDSPHEIAESFAYMLTKYLNMTDKLYSGSNIDLIAGTHQGLPEALLKEILKRKINNKEIVGFEKIEDIGGALKFTEDMDFLIKTDEQKNKRLTLNFRGQTNDIDMEKLNELAKSYTSKTKK